MKKSLFFLVISLCSLQAFAQLGIGGGAAWVVPMNRNAEFYGGHSGFKLFFTPDVSDEEVSWNFGFAYTKFTPRKNVFETFTPNGVIGNVKYTNYTSIPVFAGLDFKITKKPIGLYAGAYIGANYINYTTDNEDYSWGYNRYVIKFNGLNAFFSPRIGAVVVDTERFAISLDAQYFATLNKKAGWLEDYVGFSLNFIYKTSVYM